MLTERPQRCREAGKRYAQHAAAVEHAVAYGAGRFESAPWVPTRAVYVAFHGHEPTGYPSPMPRFVRALKEAARADLIDGRWADGGFEWRPHRPEAILVSLEDVLSELRSDECYYEAAGASQTRWTAIREAARWVERRVVEARQDSQEC